MASYSAVLFGLLLGARHALEPDHLTAISVLSTERPTLRGGALLGTFWGVGHTAALLGVAVVLAGLRVEMPDRLADAFELGVAVMLIVLGVRALMRARVEGRAGSIFSHAHGAAGHSHAGPAAHVHVGRWTLARRPFLVGVVHGAAGSGALTALVAAELPTWPARFSFMALFGLGSVVGMAVLSGLAGWPLARLGRTPRAAAAVSGAAGVVSMLLGVCWGWPLVGKLLGA